MQSSLASRWAQPVPRPQGELAHSRSKVVSAVLRLKLFVSVAAPPPIALSLQRNVRARLPSALACCEPNPPLHPHTCPHTPGRGGGGGFPEPDTRDQSAHRRSSKLSVALPFRFFPRAMAPSSPIWLALAVRGWRRGKRHEPNGVWERFAPRGPRGDTSGLRGEAIRHTSDEGL